MVRFTALVLAGGILSACASDPLRDVPRLADADVAEATPRADIADDSAGEAAPQGFLAGLLGGGGAGAQPATEPESAAETAAAADADTTPARGGLLGFLSRAADEAQTEEPETTEVAALPATTTTDAAPTPVAQPRRGLFGARASGPKPGDPDFEQVTKGTVLPYGRLARMCNASTRSLGTRIEKGAGYALYDSNPGSTGLRSFYLTGFDDGCARQFTAALAVFGTPEMHELLRYGLPAKVQPYSDTDAAYEKVKSRVCRVGRGKPCGRSMNRLSRDTVFVSVYERFGSNPVWKTILLHDGGVVAADLRSN